MIIGNSILFFLNNFKSTAAMVTPKFRFILLKILNKIIFGKQTAGNTTAVVVILIFYIKTYIAIKVHFLLNLDLEDYGKQEFIDHQASSVNNPKINNNPI